MQIYFDFSGYSDMAIGLARMLGFRLRENFDAPYVSRSLTEFWRRWHISLTTWIRDYLYMPLGGNRPGEARTYINLWICFLPPGCGTAPAWNFVLWGAYNGLFLTLDRMFLRDTLERCGHHHRHHSHVVHRHDRLGALPLRAAVANILPFLGALFGNNRSGSGAGNTVPRCRSRCLIGALSFRCFRQRRFIPGWLPRSPAASLAAVVTIAVDLVVIYVLALARAFAVPFQPFIYFRF